MNRFWSYNSDRNKFTPVQTAPLSAFPTIVDVEKKIVYCRRCHRWEYIIGFTKNILRSQCGAYYKGPFIADNSIFSYGYDVEFKNGSYFIDVLMQQVSSEYRRLITHSYELNLSSKVLYKDGKLVVNIENTNISLCEEISKDILRRLGEIYKKQYGIKPTIASSLRGFNVVVGYMLCPFNVNFFKISQFWGLNPYDTNFTSLSSGDTPDAENEMFSCMGIKPTKTIRKMYQQIPQSIVCYAAAKDMGFTDVNILQKSWSISFYAFLKYLMISFAHGTISYTLQTELKLFVADMLAISNQKAVWNSLHRSFNLFSEKKILDFLIRDGISMYGSCREELDDQEKKDILHEGFNEYTHDFLVRHWNGISRRNKILNSNGNIINFDIEDSFIALEYKAGDNTRKKKKTNNSAETEYENVPDEDRYCFLVARNSEMLKIIGSEMHNCVGWGYAEAVRDRRTTIVYALYKNKYKICIEVTPQFTIRQAFGPSNSALEGDSLDAYREWCEEKRIRFEKAFSVHCAP